MSEHMHGLAPSDVGVLEKDIHARWSFESWTDQHQKCAAAMDSLVRDGHALSLGDQLWLLTALWAERKRAEAAAPPGTSHVDLASELALPNDETEWCEGSTAAPGMEKLEELLDQLEITTQDYFATTPASHLHAHRDKEKHAARAAILAHHAEAVKRLEEKVAAWIASHADQVTGRQEAEAERDSLRSELAALREQKPVAWMAEALISDEWRRLSIGFERLNLAGLSQPELVRETPLYASPVPSSAPSASVRSREEAEALLGAYDAAVRFEDRAALEGSSKEMERATAKVMERRPAILAALMGSVPTPKAEPSGDAVERVARAPEASEGEEGK